LPISAVPAITPSIIFFAPSKVPPGKVLMETFPPVLFSTSFFHRCFIGAAMEVTGSRLPRNNAITKSPTNLKKIFFFMSYTSYSWLGIN
jgi:hypothetical protein